MQEQPSTLDTSEPLPFAEQRPANVSTKLEPEALGGGGGSPEETDTNEGQSSTPASAAANHDPFAASQPNGANAMIGSSEEEPSPLSAEKQYVALPGGRATSFAQSPSAAAKSGAQGGTNLTVLRRSLHFEYVHCAMTSLSSSSTRLRYQDPKAPTCGIR